MVALAARPRPPLPAIRYRKHETAVKELITEALEEYPPLPGLTMRANTIRLLVSMWYVQGSLAFSRGWVRQAMQAFFDIEIDCPNARCWRSYRADLKENPGQFLSTSGVPVDLIRQLELDLMGCDHASI